MLATKRREKTEKARGRKKYKGGRRIGRKPGICQIRIDEGRTPRSFLDAKKLPSNEPSPYFLFLFFSVYFFPFFFGRGALRNFSFKSNEEKKENPPFLYIYILRI